ncbi:MAG: alpha/beta fold hydrolase [Planctomycetes bacterium]|nr:alpha/beta fold hydrolase [Planctomycetota bacterium]
MGIRLYKTTGASIRAATRLLGVHLRLTGLERLPDRPVLFVVNHFTRFETFLVPYVIYRRFDVPVRTLATHSLFGGWFGRYLEALGVLSTRAPDRNRTIIHELMTGRAHWVIYPEGGLIKNKKTVARGRLRLERADRSGPPHTGAAVLALKAELRKRRYLDACARGDETRRAWYEQHYGFAGPDDVSPKGTVVIPVNVTYPRMRSGPNMMHTAARVITRTLDPRLDEELRVEGSLLFGSSEVSVHFGDPIVVGDYLDRASGLARRMAGWMSEERRTDLFLLRQARRLTQASMRSIYHSTEINLDHLFCYGLRALRLEIVPVRQFHRALFLVAMELRHRGHLRLHPALRNGIVALATGEPYANLDTVERLAIAEGVIRREGDCYVIDREQLHEEHDFHDIRLSKMVQVIANELEPIEEAVEVVRRVVNLDENALGRSLSRSIRDDDEHVFRHEHRRGVDRLAATAEEIGAPFFLEHRNPRAGIVVAHGYLSTPEQIRPLAEHLHARGFSVYGVRLDGHGTTPEHLDEVTWQGWMDSLTHAYEAVRHHSGTVIVGGFSLGGVLAALLAARCGVAVDGLFTINAPMKLRNPWAPLVPVVLRLDRLVHRLRRRTEAPSRSVRNDSESPDINYDTDYLWGIRELRRAIRACRRGLPDVTAPSLVMQCDDDPVVDPRSASILHDRLGSETRLVVRMPGARHLIVRGDRSAHVFDRVDAFVERICLPAADRASREAGVAVGFHEEPGAA